VLIISTGFSAMRMLTFAWRGAKLLPWLRPIRPFGCIREVNLQFGTLQASGRGLGTGVVASVRAS
jgi:hypothetical protein